MDTTEEPLSAATALIGLLAVGGRTMDRFWDLTQPAKSPPAPVLVQALQEMRQCRSTVHVLFKTLSLLEAAQLPLPERRAWIAVDDLIAALADTVLALSDLQAVCQALDRRPLAAPEAREVGLLCSRVRWLTTVMTMMTTILKCPGDADARSARRGLELRMRRILTSNAALAARMLWLSGMAFAMPKPEASEARADAARGPVSTPFSGLTLADVSVLAMIPLPVTTGELCDGPEVYTAAFARRAARDLSELLTPGQAPASAGTRADKAGAPVNTPKKSRLRTICVKWRA